MTDSLTPGPLELHGKLWLSAGGRHLGGPDRIALLAAIARHGSITQAAKAVGMSYKGAWDAVDAMNNLAGTPLVERLAGGKGGGGTRLTERGGQLVAQFRRLEDAHRRFIEQLGRNQDAEGLPDIDLLQVMNMKTSARNQFLGTVEKVTRGAVNDEVVLRIVGDQRIVAVVTHESAASLGLAPGTQAFALVKASSVIVAAGLEGAKLSARNQLAGTVARVVPGAVNAEVTIALPGGGTIAATVTRDSAEGLELVAGMPATALFKASSVIIGVL
ncbi:TOBE domain-containing protein [Pseudoduganella albidiflava]|uniref:LysR family transcriptional regulator n=1 Tax=Pseudoduganella albidiflava TaxID=321983 RepID=A0A411X1B9_9BURK|nr:TOBE domain-containing protein [Pseudoduganella albidiflava]QBI02776.1 LysR family transcriptional regulator [Pseudoduganella albidiflava]GGY56206.1 ModE family transcriptional regulator [Pseudoduganella albidiflava]